MSGKRQHFLPRFLQKGFTSRISGNQSFAWVFKKNVDPYETNIQNIGVERYFYASDEQIDIDDIVTDKEKDFIPVLDELRKKQTRASLEDSAIPEFIVHLVTRSRNTRMTMVDIGHTFIELFRKGFCTPDAVMLSTMKFIENNPDELRNIIQTELNKNGFSPDSDAVKEICKLAMALAPAQLKAGMPDMFAGLHHAFDSVQGDMSKTVKNAQLGSLQSEVVPPRLVERINHLKWSIVVEPKHSFILGDIGPIAKNDYASDYKSLLFFQDDENPNCVYLPITDQHLIVGTEDRDISFDGVNEVNVASASLSSDFFIGSRVTGRERNYAELLG